MTNAKLISGLYVAIGRYSVEICRPDAELAPPIYLTDAVRALETQLTKLKGYANHRDWCSSRSGAECNCGLESLT